MLPCECIFLCSQVSARAWDPSACVNECSEKDMSVPVDRNWQSPNRFMASHM